MDPPSEFQRIVEKIEFFVKTNLDAYHPSKNVSEKSIRDAVWGTMRLYPWEVAILDSPLIQRLRDIHQTGLAYLVYPTAQHSRFDHTLGMITVVTRIVSSINEKTPHRDPRIPHQDHCKLRMSALLHDVGHSIFSHVSEGVYNSLEEFPVVAKFIKENYGVQPKGHEILSWLIVRSERFKKFIHDLITAEILKGWECRPADIDEIADNIIGFRKQSDKTKKFETDIINGPMDADKLDYLVRDAYFAGPPVVYDLDRFLRTIEVISLDPDPEQQTETRRLTVGLAGVTALEQIILSKLMMYSYVYHHHKVRCVHGMCQEALNNLAQLASDKKRSAWKNLLPWLGDASAFLEVSDRSLFPPAKSKKSTPSTKVAQEILNLLVARRLYKRALIISRLFIKDLDSNDQMLDSKVKKGFQRFLALRWHPERLLELRRNIFTEAKRIMTKPAHKGETKELAKVFKEHHVLVDIPKMPNTEEAADVSIQVTDSPDPEQKRAVPLTSVFPLGQWVETYNMIKWRAHVFALEEAAPYVSAAAIEVLSQDPYGLKFEPDAIALCKLNKWITS